MIKTKTNPGNFFEDFRLGQEIVHATPRTVSDGDSALYTALYGVRFASTSSAEFARAMGFPRAPLDDMLAFHMVFGKTVPDISLNAIANLGYAEGRFGEPVFPGDTLSTTSTVIGLRQNKDGKSGVVYVRSTGVNQRGAMVLDYCRWVMVRKNNEAAAAPEPSVPSLADSVAVDDLIVPANLRVSGYDRSLAGSQALWDDYEDGEKIDHVDGMTIEEAEHMIATRLYQNTAKVHFDQMMQKASRFGRRLIYGGHIISIARSLSFNGLANAFKVAAINGGRHVAPTFAGDTIYAWSQVMAKLALPGRTDLGALRLRTIAAKDKPCADFPLMVAAEGAYDPAVVLDLDYTVLMPRSVT
jgi:2-methylfumaryl-CoA hydratase